MGAHLKPFRLKHKQRGSAIIIALFVMSLVATAATAMMFRMSLDVHRTQFILTDEKMNLLAQGATTWAIDTLNTNWKHKVPTALVDALPANFNVTLKDSTRISAKLSDAEGLFNLNSLSDINDAPLFQHFLAVLDPTLPKELANQLFVNLIAWQNPNDKKNNDDAYYAEQTPSYRMPHHPMVSPSELRLVKGMTAKLYLKILPFVSALGKGTKININTAPAEVFCSLAPNLTLDIAKNIVQLRQAKPFVDVQTFLNLDTIKNLNAALADKITITSGYFLLKTVVSSGQQHLTLYTLLKRNIKDEHPMTTVLWQLKGSM
jgi:general secretion pathway protein K